MAKFSDWNAARNRYKDFRHGAVDLNDFEDQPYRHAKRRNKCEHVWGMIITKWSYVYPDGTVVSWQVNTCKKCGKHGKYWTERTTSDRRRDSAGS
jgi:hypothetical protein